MSRHLGLSIPPLDERRWRLLEQETSHSRCGRPDEPGIAVAEKGGPVVRVGADEAALPVTAPMPGAEGHSRTPPQMQEQSCPPSPQPLPGKQILPGSRKNLARSCKAGRKAATARPTKGGATGADDPETQEPGRQPPSAHPPVAHAWFVVFSPLTASGQRTEVTALVTASGHECGKGDRVTACGHADLPDEHGNANTPTETDSGHNTATGHLARANMTRSTVVRRPQSITT